MPQFSQPILNQIIDLLLSTQGILTQNSAGTSTGRLEVAAEVAAGLLIFLLLSLARMPGSERKGPVCQHLPFRPVQDLAKPGQGRNLQ